MKETVVLINPPLKPDWEYKEESSSYPPMGILYIGSLLRNNGYQVKIVDGALEKNYIEMIKDVIDKGDVAFAGLSVMTAQILPALKISEYVRQHNSSIKIVWGGIHPTLFPEHTLREELVDIVVIGEGEYTALELAGTTLDPKNLSTVKGIAYKNREGKIIFNESRELVDINKTPPFQFDLINIEKYINKDLTSVGGKNLSGGYQRRSLPVLAGLGCPYRCTFCINAILKKKYRPKQADLIIQEVETLMKKYNANDFGMIDEDFFVSKKRVEDFLNLIEEKKLRFSWHTSTRANYFVDSYINENFLHRLRRSGFFHFGLGAESGSERILKLINKGITVKQVENVAFLSKKCDVNVGFSFMCALPGETEEESLQTINFCYRLIQINPKNYIIGPQVFRPYPGSPLYDTAVQYGLPLLLIT